MPHQRGDPMGFAARSGRAAVLRDSREPPAHAIHPAEFQRRRLAPILVHHPSPGAQQPPHPSMHPGMYHGSHPHSPAWYGSSVATNSPHRVPGGSSHSVASNETIVEEPVVKKEAAVTPEAKKTPMVTDEEMRKKQEIIHEALRRHMDDDNSIGTNEADAASALLFATAAMRRAEQQQKQKQEQQQQQLQPQHSSKVSVAGSTKAEGQGTEETQKGQDEEEEEEAEEEAETSTTSQGGASAEVEKPKEESNESSGPLKKRRKLMNFLRNKPVATATTEKQPLHVSPLPSPQVRSRVAGHESSEETVESTSPPRTAGSSSTCMENTYDVKETQTLHEGAKIQNAAEISPPPSQVVIEHFPTLLHSILTSSEFAGSVVQWLPDGEAWKILRWDALRRQVLPKYFSQLRDEDGKVGSSIDTFLWHLAGWGFEEIQDGPDVGAYKNKLFRKDSAQLCRQMAFAHKQGDLESPPVAKKTPSTISDKLREASQPHSLLQVPSLASRSEEACSKEVEKAALKWREEQLKRGAIHSPTVSYPSMAGRPMRHPETPVFVNYRMGDIVYAPEGWQYFPESPLGMRHLGSGIAAYEQRMLQQQRFEFPRSAALHGTPRVQSGRGALRLPIPSKAGIGAAGTPIRRSSFPVSNRGKGNRAAPGLRIPVAATSEIMRTRPEPTKPPPEPEGTAGLAKTGEEVAERVAVAVSKKTKRKLPLSAGSAPAAATASSIKAEEKKDTKVTTKEEDA